MALRPDPGTWEVRGAADAPSLLLIPPLGRDRTAWAGQGAELEEHFQCILFDPRGTGQSRRRGGYSTTAMADDARGVLDAAGIERSNLAGWSLGAAAAMVLAAGSPDRVRSLSLITPWARTDFHLKVAFTILRDLAARCSPAAAELATLWFILSRTAVNDAGEALIGSAHDTVSSAGYPDVDTLLGYLDAAIGHDVLERLPGITAPALVVGGASDILIPVEHAREVAAAIPAATLAVLEGDGATHALPAELNRLLIRFIQGVATAMPRPAERFQQTS